MSKKIIGITVGTQLPKPNFNQTDPTKGDYIKNKPDFDGLQNEVSIIHNLVGDTSVSEQIAMATSELPTKNELEQAIFEKADTVRHAEGTTIILNNSAKAPIQGLKLFGKTTQDGTPTPEAPVPLVSAGDGGSLGVTVAGKNLIDYKNAIPANSNSSLTVDESINGVHWDGTFYFLIPVNIPAGVTVTFSCKSSGDDKIYSYNLVYEDGTEDYRLLNLSILTKKRVTHLRPRKENTATKNKVTVWDMQLEIVPNGTDGIVTEYEPYKGQNLPVSTPNGLPGIPVTSGGNYTDETGQQWLCDEVDFTRGVHVQRIKQTVFDGSADEKWTGSSTGNAPYGATITDIADCTNVDTQIVCDRYPTATINESWSARNYLISRPSANSPTVCFRNVNIASLDAWKADISENPITIQYILATPIETPLSAEELAAYAALHTNYPNTTLLNDGGAGMEVKYCTPLTSVPMVHGEADSGKILAIDEHGCVTKIDSEQFGSIDVDFDISNEAEANPVNADTLGGYLAEDYVKKDELAELVPNESVQLNYSVVGGTVEPANPTENMIWVNTDTAITKHAFKQKEPRNPIEGMVWFATGNYSPASFDRIVINDVCVDEVQPLSAKQYVSGAWVDKTACSYQGGEWTKWVTYLYNRGNQCTDITGGWQNAGSAWSGGSGENFVFGEDSIHYAGSAPTNGPSTSIATVNKIDLSKYNKLKVRVAHTAGDGNFFCICYIDTKAYMFDKEIARTIVKAPYTGVVELDLSGAGEHYVGIYAMGNVQLSLDTTVYEIWFE